MRLPALRAHRARRLPAPRAVASLFVACALSACTVGPDFHAPAARTPEQWHAIASTPSGGTAGATHRASAPDIVVDTDPDPRWWHTFNDPTLDALIDEARAGNLDLQRAVLRIVEARTQMQSAASQGLPNLRASASYQREQLGLKGLLQSNGVYRQADALGAPNSPVDAISPGAGPALQQRANAILGQLSSPINLWQAGFDASWELDLFGRVRRSVEAASANLDAARESRNDALLSLEAEVAQTYLQLRGSQAARDIAERQVRDARDVLALTKSQAAVGLASTLDVKQAQAELAQAQARVTPFDGQIAQAANGLALLVGAQPGALDAELTASAPLPALPPRIAVGLPSTLARRRPDVRRAEAQLHAATAGVGVAVAQFYPDITLTGKIGTRASNASDLARWSHLFYSFGPAVSLPIFEGGALVANLHLADARQAEAALAYRRTVLVALRDVDNALAVYRSDLSHRDALSATVDAQRSAYDLARARYEKGFVSFIDVLDAQRQLSQAQAQFVQAQTQVETDVVALYKALSGGWESAA
ncbi:RND transporter [Trinickia dabaoshanensis]|uniref:RND transporter n=1 Tax=Trinickia dabaoshanensis TaxID=564714 RepID=A0A2N7VDW3_9BURK|nr:efflux transporter outer membrane subunit [Trinickia dabaoshanensis]PMS15327.1 RND transporter [Trinickia dabaoshanensis]